MFPYYMLVFLPIIVYFIGLLKGKRLDKFCICLFLGLFIVLLSLRGIGCGIDVEQYKFYFDFFSKNSFSSSYLYDKGEILYYCLNRIVYTFGGNYQIFLGVVACLSIMPIAILYSKKTTNFPLTLALFLTVAPFSMYFSGLRQIIAMGFVMLGFKYIQNKNLFKYLVILLIATFFHKSALLAVVLYPVYHLKITRKWLYLIIPIGIVMYYFKAELFSFFLHLYNPIYENMYGTISSTGQVTTFILLLIFCIYCFVFPEDNKIDKEFIGLRNFLVLATFIQMFVSLNVSVMRINYYILPFIPILIPKVYDFGKDKNKQILALSLLIMTSFFITYFFYNGYTGDDILQIFPYIPFWEV